MADEQMMAAEAEDVQFMRTVSAAVRLDDARRLDIVDLQEDHICLSCLPVSSLKRMALSGEAFGNRMCYLEDISNEVSAVTLEYPRGESIRSVVGLLS